MRGAYISAGPGGRARPTALLEGCRGKAAGAGLATQRRRALAGWHPAHGANDPLDQKLLPATQLSPWQVLALEEWGKDIAPQASALRTQQVWCQELSREKLLQGLGLSEASLEKLKERLVAEDALVEEEAETFSNIEFE